MARSSFVALFAGLLFLTGALLAQDNKPKDAKQDDPPAKAKGKLPPNWAKLGLSDSQIQEIYKVQSKHNDEIDKLEAKIKEMKAIRDKEMKAVLTPEQKKRLDDIVTGNDK